MPWVVLLTGSQKWTDARPIRADLTRIRAEHPGEVLVLRHGRARKGADAIADRIGQELGYQLDRHPARWQAPCDPAWCRPGHRRVDRSGREYCPAAGMRRNQDMVDVGDVNQGLGYIKDGSPGSTHCVKAMRAAGITVTGRGLPQEPALVLPLDGV